MQIVAISDTHNHHFKHKDMPDGDVLVHTGDFSMGGYPHEIKQFSNWLGSLGAKYDHKIVIAGNHETTFDSELQYAVVEMLREQCPDVIYLQEEEYVVTMYDDDGAEKHYKFFGSPWTPWFYDWAFNGKRGEEMTSKWAKIPEDTDILLTHGPPAGILDPAKGPPPRGCEDLLERVIHLAPKVHIFGHFHSGYGREKIGQTLFVNAASCNEKYKLKNPPQVIQLP